MVTKSSEVTGKIFKLKSTGEVFGVAGYDSGGRVYLRPIPKQRRKHNPERGLIAQKTPFIYDVKGSDKHLPELIFLINDENVNDEFKDTTFKTEFGYHNFGTGNRFDLKAIKAMVITEKYSIKL